MASASDLLGTLISGTRDVFLARAATQNEQNEIERQRAAVQEANARTQASVSALQQAQDYFNSNTAKITSYLLGIVAVSLVGVVGYNVFSKGR